MRWKKLRKIRSLCLWKDKWKMIWSITKDIEKMLDIWGRTCMEDPLWQITTTITMIWWALQRGNPAPCTLTRTKPTKKLTKAKNATILLTSTHTSQKRAKPTHSLPPTYANSSNPKLTSVHLQIFLTSSNKTPNSSLYWTAPTCP